MALLCLLFFTSQPFLNWARREPQPRFLADRVEKPWLFGSCARTASVAPDHFRAAFERNTCAYAATREAIVSSEFIPGPFGNVPVLAMRARRGNGASPRLILLELVGGPGGSIYPRIERSELTRYLLRRANEGVITLSVAYFGTKERSLFPQSDLEPAMQEIAGLVSVLRRRYPTSKVAVVGASLGGYLAVRLAGRLPDLPVLAISPLVAAPRARLRVDLLHNPYLTKFAYRPQRRYRLNAAGAVFVKEELVPIVQALGHFFGPDFDAPLSEVAEGNGDNLTILYSPADNRIGVEAIPPLKIRLPRATFLEAGRAGHAVEDVENFHAYRANVAAFIDHQLEPQGNSLSVG
jgi:pimeloyl-ACP methyl ester carboxylesterase